MLRAHAYAKINLTLEIIAKRNDGYHDIASLMQKISLSDELVFEPSDDIKLSSDCPEMLTQDNLILSAAQRLKDYTACTLGANIHLSKKIPVRSGLGGGSSDAAVTLLALRSMWRLDVTSEELSNLALQIGSDIPFFLDGPLSMVTGKGEKIEPLPSYKKMYVVIVVPEITIPQKTSTMYGYITEGHCTNGDISNRLKEQLCSGCASAELSVFNVFMDIVLEKYPNLRSCRDAMSKAGAQWIGLTGSGPSMYTIVDSIEQSKIIADKLKIYGLSTFEGCTMGPC